MEPGPDNRDIRGRSLNRMAIWNDCRVVGTVLFFLSLIGENGACEGEAKWVQIIFRKSVDAYPNP